MSQLQRVHRMVWAFLAMLLLSQAGYGQQTPPAIQWQKSLGGSGDDGAASIQQTADGGYIVAGASSSTDGDVTGNHRWFDYWIVKLSPLTSDVTPQPVPAASLSAISVIPNPAQNTAVLRIECDAEAEYAIELVSAIGAVVKRQSVHLGLGDQAVELRDMGVLPSGSYQVLVTRGKQQVARGRLVLVGE